MSSNTLAIVYRIYPGISKNPAIFPNNKFKLSEIALKSLICALSGVNYRFFALMDSCPPEYEELFKRLVPKERLEIHACQDRSNLATFMKQMNLLLRQDFSDNIFFAEDDYLYLPNSFINLVAFLQSSEDVHFVTPYDHLDYYTLDFHKKPQEERVFQGKKFKTVGTTCFTFLTKKSVIQATEKTFRSFLRGNKDAAVWMTLTRHRLFDLFYMIKSFKSYYYISLCFYKSWRLQFWQNLFGKKWKLWCPEPSVGTHLEKDYMAPQINWTQTIETYSRESQET